MMAAATINDRRIRKLRLKVDHSSRVHRGSALIEEALRLATVPGENQGRSYHFRYLNLGAIKLTENIIQVTARLEMEFQRLVSQAVHVEDPQAATSVAVYFRSPLEPVRYVLARIARGLPHDAWFVRAALPQLQPSFTPAEIMRHVIAETARQPDGSMSLVTTAQLFAELLQRGELLRLLSLIEPEVIVQLFRPFADYIADQTAVSLPDRKANERIAPAPLPTVRVPSAWVVVLERAIQLWGSNTNDVRTIWLAAISLVAEAPVRSTDSQLPAKADAVVAKVLASPATTISRSRIHPRHSAAFAPVTKPAPPSGRISFEEAQRQLFQQPSPAQPQQRKTHLSDTTAPEAPAVDEETEYQPSALSRHAGFYFLLHVLRRLGIVEFLAAHPELADINFPWLLLRALAKHIGIKDDDPIINFAGKVAEEDLAHCFEVKLPQNWKSVFPLARQLTEHDYVNKILLGNAGRAKKIQASEAGDILLAHSASCGSGEKRTTEPALAGGILSSERDITNAGTPLSSKPTSVEKLIRCWIVAVHRWLKRYAHLKISEIVNRRGAVTYARPQADITLLLNDVDLRIRRLGLDLDPGWLPWLGLIVHIHYEHVLGVNECPAP